MVELNLFKLQDKEDKRPLSWICASGDGLSIEVERLLNKLYLHLKRKELDSILTSELKISRVTAIRLRRKNRKWYPLIFLETLGKIWRKYLNKTNKDLEKLYSKLQSKIEMLKCNNGFSKPIRAVKELTVDLCKIVGAHAADGTMYDSLIRITDEDKQAVEKFKKWIENLFKIKLCEVKPVKDNNEWSLCFRNKVFIRYLNKFFGFPSGLKTYSVKELNIIKNSNLELRKAFTIGVLTFEAGIGVKSQIEFCIASKELRNSIYEILELLNFKIKKEKKIGKYWRLWTTTLNNEDCFKWLDLFESQTEKWFKIYELANGFQGKVNSISDTSYIFNKIYPKKSSSKISLNDVFNIILEQKEVFRYKLVELLKQKKNLKNFSGKWAHSIAYYLNILKRANIISIERRKFESKKSFGSIVREVYKLNPNVTEWRVPFRPWLQGEINYEK